MKKTVILVFVFVFSAMHHRIEAQEIDWENFDLRQIFGKVLTVEKGYAPKFYLGKKKIDKLDIVGKILNTKKSPEINRLFRTFKTGRTVYKIATYTGTAITVYGAIKSAVNNGKADSLLSTADKNAVKTAVVSGLTSVASGVLVKLLTKGASYKAVDIFGGIIQKKIRDILSVDFGVAPMYNGTPAVTASLKLVL